MSEFHLLRPLWLLALIPGLVLLIGLWRTRGEGSAWERVFDRRLLDQLWLEAPGRASHLPLWLLGSGWLLAVLILAGPVWERLPVPAWQTQWSRVIVLDLSPSMAAADLPPSRLARARFKIRDVLARARQTRTGLVVFAGEPHLVSPLTDDRATIENLLAALSTDIMPVRGDEMAPALQMAGRLLHQTGANGGDILVVSDGMADSGVALARARDLRREGYRVSVLGVGTAQGAPVPGSGDMARLSPDILQTLAQTGGGSYSPLTADDRDLATVLLPPPPYGLSQSRERRKIERWIQYGVWLLPALLLLALPGFRRGWLSGLVVLLVLPPPAAHADGWQDLWLRPEQQAARVLRQGNPAQAAKHFNDPAWRGMALYRAGDYAAAAKSFAQVPGAEGRYNQGNALAKAGDLEAATRAYHEALKLDPRHDDARHNLELVEQLLKQRRQKQNKQDRKDKLDQKNRNNQQKQQKQQNQQKQQGKQGKQGKQSQENQQSQQNQQGQQKQSRSATGKAHKPQQQRSQQDSPSAASSKRNKSERASPQVKQTDRQEPKTSQQAQQNRQHAQPKPQRDSAAAARRDVQEQARREQTHDKSGEPVSRLPRQPQRSRGQEGPADEKDLALDQWLRQIPDDPGGLLRRKFMLDHLRREQGIQ